MARAKFNRKMSHIIWDRLKNADFKLEESVEIYKDFKTMFSEEALKGITAEKIRDKYYSLEKSIARGRFTPSRAVQLEAVPEKTTGPTDLKGMIINKMMESSNMTITFNGTEITAVFK